MSLHSVEGQLQYLVYVWQLQLYGAVLEHSSPVFIEQVWAMAGVRSKTKRIVNKTPLTIILERFGRYIVFGNLSKDL